MKVLLFEDNLMWSARLVRSVQGLGHEAEVLTTRTQPVKACAAIVDLGSERLNIPELVPALVADGLVVIGHAGHKEKELHALGRDAGCQILATNSELTYRLPKILAEAEDLCKKHYSPQELLPSEPVIPTG